jgi:hypothetical protein
MSVEEAERQAQQAIVELLRESYPALLRRDEVALALAGESDGFAERDVIRNGLRDLVAQGLLHRQGEFVFLTRACVRALDLQL